MSIDVNDTDKYIFDPQNPKQCKSYKLLLSIAKKENLVYVSDDFVTLAYEKEIVNNNFNDELWDAPDNYDSLDVFEKIKIFKDILSEKDYQRYINSLEIDENKFLFNRVFQNYFDIDSHCHLLPTILKKYEENLLRTKIKVSKYKMNTYSYSHNHPLYNGSKILFTNGNIDLFNKTSALFDVASVLVTSIDNKEKYFDSAISKKLKPIFLKDMSDLKILLNVLEHDLKRENRPNLQENSIYQINNIEIKNFFSIKEVKLENLKDKKEVYIVGENGDGKTLFLQALALALMGIDEGDVFDLVKSQKNYFTKIEDSSGNKYIVQDKNNQIHTNKDLIYKNFFAYGANRNNNCGMKKDEAGYLTLFGDSFDLKNPMDWLKYLDHSEKSEKENIISVENAKNLLQELLESDVEINIEPKEVTFVERGSEVSFEQLSAGYKGVITIVADLLVRLSENQPHVESVEDFKGIVVIDEVELHLHPKWKYNFVEKLRTIFPNIQFIMTTHSPTVILGASKEAVFYKIYKENSEVKISNQIQNEGYTNNTLVSSPLFDLETFTSRHFDKSISSDDYIYDKIHQKIAEKISTESMTDKDRISKLIDEELAKL